MSNLQRNSFDLLQREKEDRKQARKGIIRFKLAITYFYYSFYYSNPFFISILCSEARPGWKLGHE